MEPKPDPRGKRAEEQRDLLGDQSFSADLAGHLDKVPVEIRNKWPKDLAALCDIYDDELTRLGLDAEMVHRISLTLLMAQANYGGGRMFYIPKGDRLRQAIRNRQIYAAFRGNNHAQLAQQYGLTVQRIYDIVREQGAIEKQRVQPGLF